MSIVPRIIPTDEFYQYDFLHDSQKCLGFLNGEVSSSNWVLSFEYIFHVFNEMENEAPFTVVYDSRYTRPVLTEDAKFKYRRSVWCIIFQTMKNVPLNKNLQDTLSSFQGGCLLDLDQKSCALFLKEQLKLLKRHAEFESWVVESKEKIKKMGMSMSVNGSHVDIGDVNIVYDPNITGENAKVFMVLFLTKVIEKLKETKE